MKNNVYNMYTGSRPKSRVLPDAQTYNWFAENRLIMLDRIIGWWSWQEIRRPSAFFFGGFTGGGVIRNLLFGGGEGSGVSQFFSKNPSKHFQKKAWMLH